MPLANRHAILSIVLAVLLLFSTCASASIASITHKSNLPQQLVSRQEGVYVNITAYPHNIRGMEFSTSCSRSGNNMTQCDFYFNPNKLAYWEQPTVCVIYGYIRLMRDSEVCIMQVPENPCLTEDMHWLQQCSRDIYFAGTFLLNHTRAFQGNSKIKSVRIPTNNLIDPRQIVFESYGHLFTGAFKSAPTSKGNATMLH